MSLVSINIRGLVKAARVRTLSKLIQSTNLGIIMLQETMCEESYSLNKLAHWLPGWEFSATILIGLSGRVLVGWESSLLQL